MRFFIALLFGSFNLVFGRAIPSEELLLLSASGNGAFKVIVVSYDQKEKIAVLLTPGREPERKPYLFDGESWIPLWSPFTNE